MDEFLTLLVFVVFSVFVLSHLAAIVTAAVKLFGYAVIAGAVWYGLSAIWRWLNTPASAQARRAASATAAPAATPGSVSPSAASDTAAAPQETARRRVQVTVLPRRAGADGPERSEDGRGELLVIGPGLGKLAERVDPVTRTAFAHGEHAVRCGACGRLYKIGTCQALQYRCLVDRASLRVRKGR